jgi:hypothetical protein
MPDSTHNDSRRKTVGDQQQLPKLQVFPVHWHRAPPLTLRWMVRLGVAGPIRDCHKIQNVNLALMQR